MSTNAISPGRSHVVFLRTSYLARVCIAHEEERSPHSPLSPTFLWVFLCVPLPCLFVHRIGSSQRIVNDAESRQSQFSNSGSPCPLEHDRLQVYIFHGLTLVKAILMGLRTSSNMLSHNPLNHFKLAPSIQHSDTREFRRCRTGERARCLCSRGPSLFIHLIDILLFSFSCSFPSKREIGLDFPCSTRF